MPTRLSARPSPTMRIVGISDVLPKLARVLGVRVEELLGEQGFAPPRRPGPIGKLQRAFQLASSLSRKQQELVTQFVETLAEQNRRAS